MIDIDEAEVRHGWQKYSAWKRIPSSGHEASGEEFDAWLQSVKADAWDEGFHEAGWPHARHDDNPYRSNA